MNPERKSQLSLRRLEKLRRSVRGRLVQSFSREVIDAAIGDVVRVIETHWKK